MGFGQMASLSNAFRILALSRSGIGGNDLSIVEEEISTFVGSGYVIFEPWVEILLAGEYLEMDGADKALELTEHALQRISETGLRQFESIALFTKGDALWARDLSDAPQAEQCYLQAIDISRSQSAKWWELRASTRLAHLWQSQGKTTEAHDLLAPVYDWFTEGFDTADLKDAKALLEELS